MKDFAFDVPLIEGVIVSRRNRFVVDVRIGDEVHVCHCPTTGHIGDFELAGRPCLLSYSDSTKRKTRYTMEAISLDEVSETNKSWIGINQVANNRYIEHFLSNGELFEIIGPQEGGVQREVPLGKAKIDFQVGNCFVEVKSPIRKINLPLPPHVKRNSKPHSSMQLAGSRLVKHIESLHKYLKPDQRAIFIIVFVYDHPALLDWEKRQMENWKKEVMDSKGMALDKKQKQINQVAKIFLRKYYRFERWQVNLNIDSRGVRLSKCIKLGWT